MAKRKALNGSLKAVERAATVVNGISKTDDVAPKTTTGEVDSDDETVNNFALCSLIS